MVDDFWLFAAEFVVQRHTRRLESHSAQLPGTVDLRPLLNGCGESMNRWCHVVAALVVCALLAESARAAVTGTTGGGAAHENMQPSLGLNYIIALQGIFPSQSGEGGAGGLEPYRAQPVAR